MLTVYFFKNYSKDAYLYVGEHVYEVVLPQLVSAETEDDAKAIATIALLRGKQSYWAGPGIPVFIEGRYTGQWEQRALSELVSARSFTFKPSEAK